MKKQLPVHTTISSTITETTFLSIPLPGERWLPVKDHSSNYFASNMGRLLTEQAQQKGWISVMKPALMLRVSSNGFRRQDNQAAPSNSSDMAAKSNEQTRSQPHRQQSSQQQDNKLGVGNTSREHLHTHKMGRAANKQGENCGTHILKEPTSFRDTSSQRKMPYRQIAEKYRVSYNDPRHYFTEILVSSVAVHTTVDTYAIDVEDTHDYCITTKNVLVGNSGKTYFATNHAWISALKDQGRYFVVFKTYKQAHEVVWRQYVPLIPKELIYKKNENDLLIELNYVKNTPLTLPDGTTVVINHDENKPRSTIQLLGSDRPTSSWFSCNGPSLMSMQILITGFSL